MEHEHDAITADVSRLIVQLLQVLLAFVLGQALIQNRELLIEIQDRSNAVGLIALFGMVVLAVESWIDWHVDVARHPFRIGIDNDQRRWAMARLWFDVSHVLAIAYLGLTVAHVVGTPDASLVRHLAGYVAVHLLLLLSNLVRDKTYGRHAEILAVQFQTLLASSLLWVVYVLVARPIDDRELLNLWWLLLFMAISIAHHARLRRVRMLT